MAQSLEVNKSLQELNISKIKGGANTIGNEGIRYFSEMLQLNKTLIKITMNENNIDDKGMTDFASSLKDNNSLSEISLGSINRQQSNRK